MSTVERWFLALYAILLLALIPWQSLWLDELMEVVATHDSSLPGVITGYALHSAGQSPLGSIEQWLAIHLFGFSNASARLPAALSSVLALWGIWKLSQRAQVSKPWVCALLFATIPLQLRYATEARPYSQALCVSAWLTYFALDLPQQPRRLLAYFAVLCFGLYTQPFVVFLAAAHICWLALPYKRRALQLCLATLAACLLYLPWYLAARSHWSQEVSAEDLHFHWQLKLPLVILRELLGTGYTGTTVALVLAACAWRNRRVSSPTRSLLLWSTVLPLVLVVAADAKFDYFFAIRQVITLLPAFCVLIAFGLETLPLPRAILTLFLALNLGYAARWFTKPREDWRQAAQTIAANLGGQGCYQPIPSGTASYYNFFRPDLSNHLCSGRTPATLVLAISPYIHDRTEPAGIITNLTSSGYSLSKMHQTPEIDVLQLPGKR